MGNLGSRDIKQNPQDNIVSEQQNWNSKLWPTVIAKSVC